MEIIGDTIKMFEFHELSEIASRDFSQHLDLNQILVVLIRIKGFAKDLMQFERYLTNRENERYKAYQTKSRAQQFIIHRGILRLLCARCLAQPKTAIHFAETAYHKPFIKSQINQIDLRFNLSHSQNHAIYAFALKREIGIDIEATNNRSVDLSGAESVLAPSELGELYTLPSSNRIISFLKLWTQKEAISKALGLGLALNFKDIVLGFEQNKYSKVKIMGETIGVHDISQYNEYVAALAVEMPNV